MGGSVGVLVLGGWWDWHVPHRVDPHPTPPQAAWLNSWLLGSVPVILLMQIQIPPLQWLGQYTLGKGKIFPCLSYATITYHFACSSADSNFDVI